MSKITFITFYNDYSVGVNILTSLLIEAGHDVSVIFFKLPSKSNVEAFSDEMNETMEAVNAYGDIIAGDAKTNRWTEREVSLLISKLIELSPEIVCLNSRTMDNTLAEEIYPRLREAYNAVYICGGFGPSLNPEIYAPLVDYVFVGEAEGSIVELIDLLRIGKSIRNYNNIYYLDNGRLVRNVLSPPDIMSFKRQITNRQIYYIENDTCIPFEDRGRLVRTHTYSTFYGRGCVSSCSYCCIGNWNNLYEQEGYHVSKRRNRQPSDVIDELISARKTGVTFVHFRDEFLTDSKKNLREFFQLYEKKINLPFWAYFVPKQMLENPDLLELAVDAGFVDTEIGFQSGSDRINREVFHRFIPHKDTLAYVERLSRYNVNRKYDFIIFNPAETRKDIEQTFALIKSLPKDRSYLLLVRLFYFPNTPIAKVLKKYSTTQFDADDYFRIALLYLLCFAVSGKEFDRIIGDNALCSSSRELHALYKGHISREGIEFPVGTHEIPESITTHRYRRIMEKRKCRDVVVWGNGRYFRNMKDIFFGKNIKYHVDHREDCRVKGTGILSPDILNTLKEPLPLFVCSAEKQDVMRKMLNDYKGYSGDVIV